MRVGQQGFDQLAQAAREHRRRSAGADRDHHLAAIDDGGEDEGRELRPVDDIDRDALRGARARRFVRSSASPAARNDGGDVAQVGWQRIADIDLEPAAPGKRQHLFRNVGDRGKPAHMRAGGAQQAQLAERGLARADKNKDTRGGIEEQRQETHRANLPDA